MDATRAAEAAQGSGEGPVTAELPKAISEAFNSRDVERILSHFAIGAGTGGTHGGGQSGDPAGANGPFQAGAGHALGHRARIRPRQSRGVGVARDGARS